MCTSTSLIPPPSVFELLSVCRNGKAQEIWSHAVASRRQRVDKQGGGGGAVLDHNDSCLHWPIPSIMNDERYWCCLVSALVFSSRTEIIRASRPFIGEHPRLSSVYLTSSHMTRPPRPSPLPFAYCKCSKSWGENGLGTRLYYDLPPKSGSQVNFQI